MKHPSRRSAAAMACLWPRPATAFSKFPCVYIPLPAPFSLASDMKATRQSTLSAKSSVACLGANQEMRKKWLYTWITANQSAVCVSAAPAILSDFHVWHFWTMLVFTIPCPRYWGICMSRQSCVFSCAFLTQPLKMDMTRNPFAKRV